MKKQSIIAHCNLSDLHKAADKFSHQYCNSAYSVSFKDFIRAKSDEFCNEDMTVSVQFDQGMVNQVYENLTDNCYEADNGYYKIVDLIWAWDEVQDKFI